MSRPGFHPGLDRAGCRPLQGALPPVPPCTDNTDTNSKPHKLIFVTGNRADRSRMHFCFALRGKVEAKSRRQRRSVRPYSTELTTADLARDCPQVK